MTEPRTTRSEAERAAAEILAPLRSEEVVMPEGLPARTMERIHTAISAKELIELTTSVFVLRVCAPVLDILAQVFRPADGGGTR
jgi:hypothetical protein